MSRMQGNIPKEEGAVVFMIPMYGNNALLASLIKHLPVSFDTENKSIHNETTDCTMLVQTQDHLDTDKMTNI